MSGYRSKGDNIIVAVGDVWEWIAALCAQWLQVLKDAYDAWMTGQSKLERILSRGEYSAEMAVEFFDYFEADRTTPRIRDALTFSDPIDIPRIRNETLAVHTSPKNPVFRSRVLPNVDNCLRAINAVNGTVQRVVDRAETAYDVDNAEHESGLAELWRLLRPRHERSGRRTKEWQELGFQGVDPATDFRGMGLLGLEQMLFMAREETERTRGVVAEAAGTRGYPWAITVIQLTSYALSLLRARRVLVNFLSLGDERGVRAFHQLTADLLFAFHRTWVDEEPENVMAFPRVFGEFKTRVEAAIAGRRLAIERL